MLSCLACRNDSIGLLISPRSEARPPNWVSRVSGLESGVHQRPIPLLPLHTLIWPPPPRPRIDSPLKPPSLCAGSAGRASMIGPWKLITALPISMPLRLETDAGAFLFQRTIRRVSLRQSLFILHPPPLRRFAMRLVNAIGVPFLRCGTPSIRAKSFLMAWWTCRHGSARAAWTYNKGLAAPRAGW